VSNITHSKLPGNLGKVANENLEPSESVLKEAFASGIGIVVTRNRVLIVKAGLSTGSSDKRTCNAVLLAHVVGVEVFKGMLGTTVQVRTVDPAAPFNTLNSPEFKITLASDKTTQEIIDLINRGSEWWRSQTTSVAFQQPSQPHVQTNLQSTTPPAALSQPIPPVASRGKIAKQKPKTPWWMWVVGSLFVIGVIRSLGSTPNDNSVTNASPPPPTNVVNVATPQAAPRVVSTRPPPAKPLTASEKLGNAIAQVARNPKSIRSTSVDRGRTTTAYDYKVAGTKNFTLYVKRNKASAWQVILVPSGAKGTNFSGVGNVQEMRETPLGNVYKYTNGPLKGAFLDVMNLRDGTQQLMIQSRDYVVNEKSGWAAASLVEANAMPGVTFIPDTTIMSQCEKLVTENLKSPSSAKFAGFLEKLDAQVSTQGNGDRLYKGYVDSQNGFGAMLRTQFECSYTASDDTLRVQFP
jgi:hypothetical protein